MKVGALELSAKRFDWIVRGDEAGPDPVCDVPIRSTPDAVAIPTIGAIVPNWLLIVPRGCSTCVADLAADERRKVLQFARELANEMRPDNDCIFFEHGARASGDIVGCGVDQAHLHVLSTSIDLVSAALSDPEVVWAVTDALDPWRGLDKSEYLLIQGSGEAFVGRPRTSQSQYFRKLIARAAGVPDQWDYKVWPNYENVRRTYGRFNGYEIATANS